MYYKVFLNQFTSSMEPLIIIKKQVQQKVQGLFRNIFQVQNHLYGPKTTYIDLGMLLTSFILPILLGIDL